MIFKGAQPRNIIRLNLMCEKVAEKYVEIFFSIFTGLSLSPNSLTHRLGKPQGWKFFLSSLFCMMKYIVSP